MRVAVPMSTASATATAVTLALTLAGCAVQHPASPLPAPAEATIGPEGGRVGLDDLEIVIPPGALSREQAVRVTRAIAPPPGLGPLGGAYDLLPGGLVFAAPATVRFDAPAGATAASVFLSRRDGEPFVALPTVTTDRSVLATLSASGRVFAGAACDGDDCCSSARSKLDVLLVVDDSNSMAEEQASLRVQIPRVVRAIATGDLDADGVQDRPAVESLHVGVVTSDMGGGGYPVPTCATDVGDDGRLRTTSPASDPTCEASYAPFQQLALGEDPEALVHAVSCVALAGIGGCGFEQQLEAALKALTPSGAEVSFRVGHGHGDVANAGFLRDDAVLAVVVLTDEDDASLADASLVDPLSATYTGDLNLRQIEHPEALHPVARFVDGLRALKSDPADVVLAVIAGVPTDVAAPGTSFDAILADPRMALVLDPSSPRLLPSCSEPGRGLAFPPRRLVEAASGFGRNGIVQSICQEDLGPAVDAIFGRVGLRLAGACGG